MGGYRVLEGSLGIGVLTAAILYARRFFDPMEEIAIFYNSYQSAASALEKVRCSFFEAVCMESQSAKMRSRTERLKPFIDSAP